jgi:hypothetical protein
LEGGRPVFDGTARDGVRQYLENNLADSALTWDLATTSGPVADLGSLVRLERVMALTARGDGFRFAEPLRFRVGVASTATLEHLECAIGLDDMFGSRVVTFMSDRQQMSTTAGGRYDIDVTVPPFGLRPGRYMLSVSLYSGGHYHDYRMHFGALSIVPLHDDGEGHVDDQPDRGAIAAASEWRMSEVPSGVLV